MLPEKNVGKMTMPKKMKSTMPKKMKSTMPKEMMLKKIREGKPVKIPRPLPKYAHPSARPVTKKYQSKRIKTSWV